MIDFRLRSIDSIRQKASLHLSGEYVIVNDINNVLAA